MQKVRAQLPEYGIIYDPDAEIAALIDTESGKSLGPICPGPDGRLQLEAFLNAMPPAVIDSAMPNMLTEAFRQFWAKNYGGLATVAASDTVTVEQAASTASDDAARLAELEAANATATPPPQPADTDTEAAAGTPSAVTHVPLGEAGSDASNIPVTAPVAGSSATNAASGRPLDTTDLSRVTTACPFCNGSGSIRPAPDAPLVTCNGCNGSGKIAVPVTP